MTHTIKIVGNVYHARNLLVNIRDTIIFFMGKMMNGVR